MASLSALIKKPNFLPLIPSHPSSLSKYLSTYLTFISPTSIYSSQALSSLLQIESAHLTNITTSSPSEPLLKLWENYIKWSNSIIPPSFKDTYHKYIALENFTKSMLSEHIYYNNDTYIDLWITYANYCRDDVEVLLYLEHKGICNLNWKMCYHIGKCYEKRNCFDKANEYYLKGIEIGKDNNDIINEYKEFECRMEKRVLKEINEASINIMEIRKGIMEEIERMNGEEYNVKNKRMKRCDKGKHNLILYNFKIKEDKIETNDCYYNNTPVSRGTKLVEIYNIVVNYLSNNDYLFKEKQQSVDREIKERLRRKPYSWISSKRNIKINYSNISDEVNYLARNNYQIGSETKSVISPSQKTFEAIDFFENQVSKKSYEEKI